MTYVYVLQVCYKCVAVRCRYDAGVLQCDATADESQFARCLRVAWILSPPGEREIDGVALVSRID